MYKRHQCIFRFCNISVLFHLIHGYKQKRAENSANKTLWQSIYRKYVIWPADSAEIRRKKSAGVQKMGMVCGFLHCFSTQKSADQHMSEFHCGSGCGKAACFGCGYVKRQLCSPKAFPSVDDQADPKHALSFYQKRCPATHLWALLENRCFQVAIVFVRPALMGSAFQS